MHLLAGGCPGAGAETGGLSGRAGKVQVSACVPKALVGKLKAGEWLNAALGPLGGKGGGKPTSATGSGPQLERLPEALAAAKELARARFG